MTRWPYLLKMGVRKQALDIYCAVVIYFVLFSKLINTAPYYTLNITYSNLHCPTVTTELGTARSELDCLVRCHNLGECRGFFYNGFSQSCYGTTVSIATTAFCTTMSGNIYYGATNDSVTITPVTTTTPATSSSFTPGIVSTSSVTSTSASSLSVTSTPVTTISVTLTAATATTTTPVPTSTTSTVTTTTSTTTAITTSAAYGTPCFTNSDCLISYTECIGHTCQCAPGYRLIPDSQTCTISCSSFGTTYIRLPDTVLDSSTIVLRTGVSVAQCMITCTNLVFCSGFNYCGSCGGMCRCKTEPPVYDPSDWRSMTGVVHYSRNCD